MYLHAPSTHIQAAHLVGNSYEQEGRESHQAPRASLLWMLEGWGYRPQYGAHLHSCRDLVLHLRDVRLLQLIANLQVTDGLHLKYIKYQRYKFHGHLVA